MAETEGHPLSPTQSRIESLERLQSTPAYVVDGLFSIEGRVDPDTLRDRIEAVFAKYEILRTRFGRLRGLDQPLQIISDCPDFRFDFKKRAGSLDDRKELTRKLRDQWRRSRLNATDSPLIHMTFFEGSGERNLFYCAFPALLGDASTLRLVITEILNVQSGSTEGSDEEPLQFADLAAWKSALLQEEGAEEGIYFWRKQMIEGALDHRLPFVGAGNEKNAPDFEPVACRSEISLDLEAARSLADRFQISLEVALLGCWSVLLHRYLRTERFVVGVSVDSRNQEELRSALGPLTDVLPLSLELENNETTADFLIRLSGELEAIAAWQDLFSWDRLKGSNGHAGRPRYCRSVFEFLEACEPMEANGTRVAFEHLRSDSDRYDVKLSCRLKGDQVLLEFLYNQCRVEENDVRRLADSYRFLLREIGEHPTIPVVRLRLAGPSELERIYRELNPRSQTEEPGQRLVTDLFESQVDLSPDAVAVACGPSFLTYGKLNSIANDWACRLRKEGLELDGPVGICLPRAPEMIVALLAVLKAGGAYLPLGTQDPAQRVSSVLEASRSRWVITDAGRAEFFRRQGVKVLTWDSPQRPGGRSTGNLKSLVSSRNLAYVLYTSGSTGEPKGVMIPHQGLVNYLMWAHRTYSAQDGAGSFVHSPLSFDFTITSLWLPLISGKLVQLTEEERGVDGIGALLQGPIRFDFAKLTPAHLRSLQFLNTEVHLATNTVVVGGEALSRRDFDGWNPGADACIVNEYGPTETVVGCCVFSIPSNELERLPEDNVPIGKPIDGTRIVLLNPDGELTAPGLQGEMAIGGTGLARGYAGRPDLTAQAFIPDSYGGEIGSRVYKTGDLARLLSDGNLTFLGRTDDQIKLRGYRIELDEIACAAREHPNLREAVALSVQEEDESSIVLWTRFREAGPDASEALRDFLARKLPEYMMPSRIVETDGLPLTKHGKVDREQLISRLPSENVTRAPLRMPSTEEERILLEIWKEVLPHAAMGVNDNFFRLGGDSIRSIRVLGMAKKSGLRLELSDIVSRPTIRELAECIRRGETETFLEERSQPFALLTGRDRQALPDGVEDAYPMTSMQEGMLFHSELDDQGAVYHDIVGVHLAAPYERASLERSLKDAMAAHPVLRTGFDLHAYSRPLQLVYREPLLEFGEKPIEHLSEEAQSAEVSEWMEQEKSRGFVWKAPPLIRFFVHRRSARSFHFSISFHHSLLDGWSTANLLVEVFRRYFVSIGLSDRPLPPVPTSLVRDYVVLEESERHSENGRDFWRDRLEEAPQTLCRGLERSVVGAGAPDVIRLESKLPVAVSRKAMEFSRELGIPLKSVLLAAHLNVVSLITGNRDLVTGLVSNGRLDQTDGDRVLGLFLNTLPFRFELREGTWRDLVGKVFEGEVECTRHRRYPLAEMSRHLQASELFNTAFNFVHYHVYDDIEKLEGVEVLDSTNFEQTSFTLLANFSFSGHTETISLFLDCDAARLSQKQIRLIQGYYAKALKLLAEAPEARLDPSLLLADDERRRLLVEWTGGPGTSFPVSRLERLVEDQADERPDALAVASDHCRVSYQELNRRANRLAWYLREKGVGLDDIVGVSIGRSLDLMIACLAIQKAGAAFCYLDDDLPEQRLTLMAADAGARVILTYDEPLSFPPPDGCRILSLSAAEDSLQRQPAGNLPSLGGPDHLCYVIYTSGSTGAPKGIAMTHRVLSELISWQLGDLLSSAPARVLQYTALSFDVSFQEIFSTWAGGGTLVLMTDEMRGHPQRLWAEVGKHEVERLFLPFAGLKQLSDISSGNPTESLALREVITAGEQLRITPEIEAFFEKHSSAVLWNQYGPAETHVVTSGRIHGSIADWPPLPDIGRPVANAKVYVLDDDFNPVPAGVRGELYLGGSMARCYLNRPGMTADRFIPHPLSSEGERLYRTGDWGRFLEDGSTEFLGRRDHQVKVRGYRIELGEVEAVLAEHPSIEDIAVFLVEPDEGEKRLAAYYTPQGDEHSEAAELKRFAGMRLPAYMIPSIFVELRAFPRTTGGKIDRVRLAKTPLNKGGLEQPIVDPGSDTERRLLELWKQVLAVSALGVEHDFFELGGHSLAATRIGVGIRNAFEVDLPLRAIFEARTIRGLAERIDRLLEVGLEEKEPQGDLESILERLDTLPSDSVRDLLEAGILDSETADDATPDTA